MFKWIEKCMNKVIELDDAIMGKCKEEELTVDVAKSNYQKYLDGLEKKQEEYKLQLCDDIKKYSRMGWTHKSTSNIFDKDFITKDYLDDLKNYFESKGFDVKFVKFSDGDGYLRISWIKEG